jgi:hypothetical protein
MKIHLRNPGRLALALALVTVTGCATRDVRPTEAQRQFAAGQEEAFAMLQRSGIAVVRVVGPFERPVVLWRPGLTLAEVLLSARYLEQRNPSQIIIQRGPTAIPVDPSILLRGEDVPVEGGDVVRVFP